MLERLKKYFSDKEEALSFRVYCGSCYVVNYFKKVDGKQVTSKYDQKLLRYKCTRCRSGIYLLKSDVDKNSK